MFREAWPEIAGRYREVEVDAFAPIGDLPPHHSQVRGLMMEFGRALQERTASEPTDAATAVELSVWAHMELVAIHPFQDGNGKTARLLMNAILMRHVTRPTLPLDIPATARERYMRCVQEARQARPEALHALIADVLEAMADQEAARPGFLPGWLRIRWPHRPD